MLMGRMRPGRTLPNSQSKSLVFPMYHFYPFCLDMNSERGAAIYRTYNISKKALIPNIFGLLRSNSLGPSVISEVPF